MRIIDNTNSNLKHFYLLNVGDVFKTYESNEVYMKIDTVTDGLGLEDNAIVLANGLLAVFEKETPVRLQKAELVLT